MKRAIYLACAALATLCAAIFIATPSTASDRQISILQQTTTGAISGVVFFDSNGDGLRDADEAGIADVALEIMDAATGGFLYSGATVSALDGSYRFEGLTPGTYRVVEVDAIGFASTTSNSVDVAVQDVEVAGVDFGDAIPLVVKGTVFNDLNADGFQTLNEPGLAGSTIQVYDDANVNGQVDVGEMLLGSAMSDAEGNYIIYNIMPGFRVARIIPLGGATPPEGDQTPLTLLSSEAGGNVRILDYPLVTAPGAPLLCVASSVIDHKFTPHAIGAVQTIWFSARMKVTGLGPSATTLTFDRSKVVFRANNVNYEVTLPKATITYSPAAATSTTTYDAATQTWNTTVSAGNYGKYVFLSGVGFVAPAGGLPGKINPVTWHGRYTTTTPGLSIAWEWAAAVYTSFSPNYGALGVKPVDGNVQNPYANGDLAGSPQTYKAFVVAGATGNGGNDYTGKHSASGYAAPCANPRESPYWVRVNSGGASYTDQLGSVWSTDKAFAAGSWGYTGGIARSYTNAVDGTFDDALYQRLRENPGEYRFSVPNGAYTVVLRFAEFQATSANNRMMKITIEGAVVETALSIYDQAGRYAALNKSYSATVNDGVLNIVFAKSGLRKDEWLPIVSAIEVRGAEIVLTPTPTPTTTPTPTPFPYNQGVNAGGVTYVDTQGKVWSGDKSFNSGSWGYIAGGAKSSSNAVAGTANDLLYQKYRENMDEYRFTVPNGDYTVTLLFAEFVVNKSDDRTMRITIEGVDHETSLSIYGLVGKNAALTRTYSVRVSDGVLNIVFNRGPGSGKEPVVSALRVQND